MCFKAERGFKTHGATGLTQTVKETVVNRAGPVTGSRSPRDGSLSELKESSDGK